MFVDYDGLKWLYVSLLSVVVIQGELVSVVVVLCGREATPLSVVQSVVVAHVAGHVAAVPRFGVVVLSFSNSTLFELALGAQGINVRDDTWSPVPCLLYLRGHI